MILKDFKKMTQTHKQNIVEIDDEFNGEKKVYYFFKNLN